MSLAEIHQIKEKWKASKSFPRLTAKLMPEIHLAMDRLISLTEFLEQRIKELEERIEKLGGDNHGRPGDDRPDSKLGSLE